MVTDFSFKSLSVLNKALVNSQTFLWTVVYMSGVREQKKALDVPISIKLVTLI